MKGRKFTDCFFAFPIKMYDPVSLRKSQEYEEDVMVHREADWVQAIARIRDTDLDKMYYQDWYSEGRSAEEVREEGFDLTMVYVDLYGEFLCVWPRKKFEEKLNEFMARREVVEDEEVEK